jgi:hypothetical protein
MSKAYPERRVDRARNSECGSARIEDLDFSRWWTDDTFAPLYIHVPHKNKRQGTIHRVFPRPRGVKARLTMRRDGVLCWLLPKRPSQDSEEA